jgi:hypothetical protein
LLNLPIVTEEMIAVVMAFVLAPALAAIHILLFRRRKESSPGYVHLPLAFLLYELLWAGMEILVTQRVPSISTWAAGTATVGFVCLAYMQVFSQIARGFSLRILVDIRNHGALDMDGILRHYSDGRGVDWLMEKRIAGLEQAGLIRRERGRLVAVRPWGIRIGMMGVWVKRILKLGQGG